MVSLFCQSARMVPDKYTIPARARAVIREVSRCSNFMFAWSSRSSALSEVLGAPQSGGDDPRWVGYYDLDGQPDGLVLQGEGVDSAERASEAGLVRLRDEP